VGQPDHRFIIGLFFLLPFPSWHSVVGLITGASVLMYAGAPLSMGAFRRQVPDATRPYRMPTAAFLCPAAFCVADLLIYWSGFEVVWKLGIVLVIGYVILGITMSRDPQRPRLNWRAAQWIPVWLIGLGIISWQGVYSRLPLGGDARAGRRAEHARRPAGGHPRVTSASSDAERPRLVTGPFLVGLGAWHPARSG
jgi:amino acid transporter